MKMSVKVAHGVVNAERALAAYRESGGQDSHDPTAICDLIADLLHLSSQTGVEAMFDFAMRALEHYEYESDPEHADEEV